MIMDVEWWTDIRCVVFLSLLDVFCFKQKTAYEMRISDWSSDVCSSDLQAVGHRPVECVAPAEDRPSGPVDAAESDADQRRRAGAEIGSASCRERVCQYV